MCGLDENEPGYSTLKVHLKKCKENTSIKN